MGNGRARVPNAEPTTPTEAMYQGYSADAAHVTLRDTAGNPAGATNATAAEIAALTLGAADAGRTYRYTDTAAAGTVVEWTGTALQIIESGGAARVYGLARNVIIQGAGTYNTTKVLGFLCIAPGSGNWTIDPIAGASVGSIPPAAFTAGQVYPIHADSIIVGTGGNALLFIPDA